MPAMTASATSSGMIASAPSSFSICGSVPSNIPVRTPIGQIACTVRPGCRCVSESHWASARAPCLVTEYDADPGVASKPAADTVQIRCPLPRSSHAGSSSRAARTWAITLTFQESDQSASLASGPPRRAIPALAQYRSISPSSARADPIRAVTPSSEAASAGTAIALPTPAWPHDSATAVTDAAFRSFSTTLAPSATNRRASAAPMPLPAPVTTTPAPATDFITDLPSARSPGGSNAAPDLGCPNLGCPNLGCPNLGCTVQIACFEVDLPCRAGLRQAWVPAHIAVPCHGRLAIPVLYTLVPAPRPSTIEVNDLTAPPSPETPPITLPAPF